MFGKGKSAGEDYGVRPRQTLAVATTAATLGTISSIGSDLTIVGKIICKDLIKLYGLVEGELNASNALIADGARIEGEIVAEELTIAGRVKGDIHALRVKLQGTAVVEGDIFHRALSVDENARFEGCSRPEDNPPEPRSSIKAESPNPKSHSQALVAFDEQRGFKADFTEEEPTELQRTGMHAFLAACIAIIAIGVISHFALSALQRPTGAYTADNVRIDPGWMERSTQLSWTELLPGPESTAVRASIPETSQTATIAQTAAETVASKADAAFLDPEQVPQTLAALPQKVKQSPSVEAR
jgi:cytoskeletal protein CcmA (bactofilin family)